MNQNQNQEVMTHQLGFELKEIDVDSFPSKSNMR